VIRRPAAISLPPLRAACAATSQPGDNHKESAVKQALRQAQWTFYALAPVLLVLDQIWGKRWF
jgi:hypothetical protein